MRRRELQPHISLHLCLHLFSNIGVSEQWLLSSQVLLHFWSVHLLPSTAPQDGLMVLSSDVVGALVVEGAAVVTVVVVGAAVVALPVD